MTSLFTSSVALISAIYLDFEQYFRMRIVIKLEQNYRSSQNILDAANAVIRNNRRAEGQSALDG